MPPPDSLILFFRILGLVASVALFVRLARLDLIRKYRIFSAYLIFASIRTAAGFPFPSNSSAYFYLWRATEPIYWAFYLLLVGEVYSLVFQGYVGIRSLSRWALMAGVVLALLVSGVTIMPLFQERMPLSQVLFYYLRIERALASSLLLFLLLILGVLAWFPISLTRNILIHCALYSAYFLSHVAGILVLAITGSQITDKVSVFLMAVSTACIFGWLLLLSRKGEEQSRVVAIGHDAEQERRLIEQLSSFNLTLQRAAKSRPPVT